MGVFACVCDRIRVCVRACVYLYRGGFAHVFTYMSLRVSACVRVQHGMNKCTCKHLCVHTCIHAYRAPGACLHACVTADVCAHACMHMHMYICVQRRACMCSDAPTPIRVRAHINTHAHTHFRAQALVPASVTRCRGGGGVCVWMHVWGGTCTRAAARESPSSPPPGRVTPCQAPQRTRSTLQCVTPPLSLPRCPLCLSQSMHGYRGGGARIGACTYVSARTRTHSLLCLYGCMPIHVSVCKCVV